jgi:hypothetical protein
MIPTTKLTVVAVLVVSTLAFSGCLGKNNEIEATSFNLAYDGSQPGSHETVGACDSEGTLAGNGAITDGSVRIQVRDGSGNTRFDKTYNQDFTIPSQPISGASGDWKITGERVGNDLLGDSFKGSYSITERC